MLRKNYSFAARTASLPEKSAQQITRLEKRQHGEFKPFMLGGLPGNITNACKRLIGHAYDDFDLRVSATTNGGRCPV